MFKPYFWKQTDKRWADLRNGSMTLRSGGCGPTTIANIVSALLNKNITPAKVWKYMKKRGYIIPGKGSTWAGITATLTHYGIDFITTYVDKEVTNSLKAGMWVLGLAGPSRWTSSGHYFCIYKLTSSNHLLISDPYSGSDYCQKDGTLNEYLSANKCNWIAIDPRVYPGYRKYKEHNSKKLSMFVDSGISNIRKARSTKSGVVAKVTRGTKLIVGDYKNGFYKIKKGKYKGYFIHENQLTRFEPYKHTYKAKTNMNVRKGATAKSGVMTRVRKGVKLVSCKRSGDWLYFPAVHGWIRAKSADGKRKYLEKIK